MAAFIGEFIVELVKVVVMFGVTLAAIFTGKKIRDSKNTKTVSEVQSGK